MVWNYVFEDFRVEQNKEQLEQYAHNVWESYQIEGLDSPFLRSNYNGYVIYENDIALNQHGFLKLTNIIQPNLY